MQAAYRLTYTMNIANGPQKGKYEQFAGNTLSLEKAKAHKAELKGNDYAEVFPITCDELDFDADERDAFRAIITAKGAKN